MSRTCRQRVSSQDCEITALACECKQRVPCGIDHISAAFLLVRWSRALTGVAGSRSVPQYPVCLLTLNLVLSCVHSHQSETTTSTASTCPRRQHLPSAATPTSPNTINETRLTMPPKGTTTKGATGAEDDVKFLLTIIKQLDGTVSLPVLSSPRARDVAPSVPGQCITLPKVR
jgi:hypothetical protein